MKSTKDLESQLEQQTTELNREKYKRLKHNEGLSQFISLLFQIGVVGIIVVGVMMIIVLAIPGLVDIDNKEFIVGILLLLLIAIVIVMVLARKNAFVLLTLMFMGISIFNFGLGFAVCSFNHAKNKQ